MDAIIFTTGNTDHMIANCYELITQYSSVVYLGMALGKKVHSYFPLEILQERMPIQNGGISAKSIADIGHKLLEYDGNVSELLKHKATNTVYQNISPEFAYD